MPFGVALPIREALHQSADDPPLTLPAGAYQLIGKLLCQLVLSMWGDRVTALNSFLGVGNEVITCYSASEDFINYFFLL